MGARYNRFGKDLALPMKVLSLLSQKDGTGKSTLAVHLAAEAEATSARRGIWRGRFIVPWRWRQGDRLACERRVRHR